jgi:hypothetical protein
MATPISVSPGCVFEGIHLCKLIDASSTLSITHGRTGELGGDEAPPLSPPISNSRPTIADFMADGYGLWNNKALISSSSFIRHLRSSCLAIWNMPCEMKSSARAD